MLFDSPWRYRRELDWVAFRVALPRTCDAIRALAARIGDMESVVLEAR